VERSVLWIRSVVWTKGLKRCGLKDCMGNGNRDGMELYMSGGLCSCSTRLDTHREETCLSVIGMKLLSVRSVYAQHHECIRHG
jgi:hypothetical protein